MQDQTLQLAQQGLVVWVYFVVLLIYRNGHEMNKDRHLAAIQKDKSTNRVKGKTAIEIEEILIPIEKMLTTRGMWIQLRKPFTDRNCA